DASANSLSAGFQGSCKPPRVLLVKRLPRNAREPLLPAEPGKGVDRKPRLSCDPPRGRKTEEERRSGKGAFSFHLLGAKAQTWCGFCSEQKPSQREINRIGVRLQELAVRLQELGRQGLMDIPYLSPNAYLLFPIDLL